MQNSSGALQKKVPCIFSCRRKHGKEHFAIFAKSFSGKASEDVVLVGLEDMERLIKRNS